MAPETTRNDLAGIGRRICRWRAEVLTLGGSAALAGLVCLFAALDIFCRLGQPARLLLWSALVALCGLTAARAWAALKRPWPIEAVAAFVERRVARLDNRLINWVQFSLDPAPDPFKRAYVEAGIEEWDAADADALRDVRSLRRVAAALAAGLLLLAAPLPLAGRAWCVALWRVLNPFTRCPPASHTKVLNVTPGNAGVPRGSPVTLGLQARGRKGQRVWLDVRPSDDRKATYDLGRLTGGPADEFAHRLSKIATDTAYRFRAGDDPAPAWYELKTYPPLALTRLALDVTPPAYTRWKPRRIDALTEPVDVPRNARVEVEAAFNRPVSGAWLRAGAEPPAPMQRAGEGDAKRGVLPALDGAALSIGASASSGDTVDTTVNVRLIPDRIPAIEIAAPTNRVALGAADAPVIRFRVVDDYGIAAVRIERVASAAGDARPGEILVEWQGRGQRQFERTWRGTSVAGVRAGTLALRVVAADNAEPAAQTNRSRTVLFDLVSGETAAARQDEAQTQAEATLARIIDIQKENLARTERLRGASSTAPSEAWQPARDAQQQVRDLTGELLRHPLQPLGAFTPTARNLHAGEMVEAVSALNAVPAAEPPERGRLATHAASLQRHILHRLSGAEAAMAKADADRRVGGLMDRVDALVRGEQAVVADTRERIRLKRQAGTDLSGRQDELAGDVTEFAGAAAREATVLETNSKSFSDLLREVVKRCADRKVKEDMLRAAERLENARLAEALPLEEAVLAELREWRRMLQAWRVEASEERTKEMLKALADARERLEKLRELESKVIETMKQIDVAADRATVKEDSIEEAELAEVRENASNALAQVARDLHIYPELSVANELVEDVYSVFEEVNPLPGSEKAGGEAAEEWGVLKPEALLEMMEKAGEHIEAMEQWLAERPDAIQYNMEAFDREEMPKMALGGLETSVDDLIGDLLKETPELAQKADDSGTNLGSPQNEYPGWEVAEGPNESFGAQGKSGNQAPDHKEQSGRSNVGRQGQAIGETAAGSGTVSEGDKNIEKRLTPEPLQSGQIQTEGKTEQNATGGGKQTSGSANETGMSGAGSNRRMDAKAPGDRQGLKSLMARTEALNARLGAMGLRTEALERAAHHMRQAGDAVAAGLPIAQVREHRRRAVAALKTAQTDLKTGRVVTGALSGSSASSLDDAVEETAAEAPREYRDLVADYYKALREAP